MRETLGFEPEYTVEYGVRELLSAIDEHVFDRVELVRNFYGNYKIEYPLP